MTRRLDTTLVTIACAVLTFVLLVFLWGLNEPPAPRSTYEVPIGAREAALYHRVETCLGRTRDIHGFHLYIWDGEQPLRVGGLPAEEAYLHETRQAVLAPWNEGSDVWIMHAAAHDIWPRDPQGRHDPEVARRCAGMFPWNFTDPR